MGELFMLGGAGRRLVGAFAQGVRSGTFGATPRSLVPATLPKYAVKDTQFVQRYHGFNKLITSINSEIKKESLEDHKFTLGSGVKKPQRFPELKFPQISIIRDTHQGSPDFLRGNFLEDHVGREELKIFQNSSINDFISHKELSASKKREMDSLLNATRTGHSSIEFIDEKFGFHLPKMSQAPFEKTGILFSTKSPDEIFEESQSYVKQTQSFNTVLSTIIQQSKPAERISVLESYLFNGSRIVDGKTLTGIDRFNAGELKAIYMKFWDMGATDATAYDAMVRMMEHCSNTNFTTNPINLEFYARAILKGHYFNMDNAHAVASLLISNPSSKTQGIAILGVINAIAKNAAAELLKEIKGGNIKEETLTFYTKCFPDSSFNLSEVEINYNGALDASTEFYDYAFHSTFDCRYGCRLMHRLIEKNSSKAEIIADMTRLASLKEGGLKSNNLAVVRNYLEALYVLPNAKSEEIELAQDVLFSMCHSESQVANVLLSLNDLKLDSAQLKNFQEKLVNHYVSLQTNPKEASKEIERKKEQLKSTTDEWDLYTYNLRGVNSNYIDGNFRFGSFLPANKIDVGTRDFFEQVINTPISGLIEGSTDQRRLLDIKDLDELDSAINLVVRDRYHTDEWGLERLDSSGHKKFDNTFQGYIALGGGVDAESRKAIINSQTNLQNNFITRLGDCRHQTSTKQVIIELCRENMMRNLLEQIFQAETSGDAAKVSSLKQEYAELNSREMHTFDCEVHLPVKIENGVPAWHDGHLVMNETGALVKAEEHTMNVEFRRHPETGNLERVTLRDTFYQNTYPWENMTINHEESTLGGGVHAGSIELYNPKTGELVKHPILIKPTHYAGTRDLYERGSNESRFIGQPVEQLTLEQALAQQDQIERHNESVRAWFENKTYVEDVD